MVNLRRQEAHTWHVAKGRELAREKRWRQAEEHFARAMDLKVTKEAAMLLGQVYLRHGRTADLAALERAIVESLGQQPSWIPFTAERLTATPETADSPAGLSLDTTEPGLAPGTTRILARQPGYLIKYRRAAAPTATLLVAFGGSTASFSGTPFGLDVAAELACDVITVTARRHSHYQELSSAVFELTVRPYVDGYEHVLALGSGLGGYAALYYGAALGAQIVAGSPRNDAHPQLGTKKAAAEVQFVHDELTDSPTARARPVILLDPKRPRERRYLDKAIGPAFPEAVVVELPFAGPNVFVPMAEQGRLTELLHSMLGTGDVPPISLQREGSHTWHAYYGRELIRQQQWTSAEAHLLEALRLKFTRAAVWALGDLYRRTGRQQDLLDLRAETERRPGMAGVLPQRWFRPVAAGPDILGG